MLTRLGDIYAYLLGWPWLIRFHKALLYVSGRALGLYNYQTLAVSGEAWIIQQIVTSPDAVVFDVGANRGDWLAEVRRVNPLAGIHAFEPQATMAAHLTANYPGVRVNNVGVSGSAGFLDLYDYADSLGSQHASFVSGVIDVGHGRPSRATKVPVVTVDDYCGEHMISRIDFLKVDVEGHELQVLEGARRMLSEGRIGAVQFEFTHLNVVNRLFISDFFKVLGDQYELHRLLPHGLLRLRDRNPWFNEQFAFQNIVALRRSKISASGLNALV